MTQNSLHQEFGLAARRQARCLDGVQIMLVDDSRSVSEAIRMMAIRSGARIRRADCLVSARKHMTIFRPDVVIVDLGLPDGNGVDLAREIKENFDPAPGVLLVSASEEDVVAVAAQSAEADGYLLKPIPGIVAFQNAILAACPGREGNQADWAAQFKPDISGSDALMHDLENVQDLLQEALSTGDFGKLMYCAQFLRGVAATADDADLAQAANALSARLVAGHPGKKAGQATLDVVNARIQESWANTA